MSDEVTVSNSPGAAQQVAMGDRSQQTVIQAQAGAVVHVGSEPTVGDSREALGPQQPGQDSGMLATGDCLSSGRSLLEKVAGQEHLGEYERGTRMFQRLCTINAGACAAAFVAAYRPLYDRLDTETPGQWSVFFEQPKPRHVNAFLVSYRRLDVYVDNGLGDPDELRKILDALNPPVHYLSTRLCRK
ncbi:MAG: hypothetical protein PHT12_06220 [Patescibacteria group bacterium]|nr:hypothetical protein [Patescibacteria group bacterium]